MIQKAASLHRRRSGAGDPTGVREQGMFTEGTPRNLGAPDTSTPSVVLPSEGDEARQEGYRGVRASHSTVEAGEISP